MSEIERLNKQFGFSNNKSTVLFEKGEGDIPVIKIENELATARISLQGAHVLSWIPKNEKEVVWLSEDAAFSKGKSLRGGIPICWPWFGAHENNSGFPAHGFARTVFWKVLSTQQLESGETKIGFELCVNSCDKKTKKMCAEGIQAEYTLTIGANLKLELITHNNSKDFFVLSEALHTYFNVENIKEVSLMGLDETFYLDKPDNFQRKKQQGNVEINAEVDRVYLQTINDVVITGKERNIIISKTGSNSTVVWNPWEQVAEKMGDLGKNGYLKMLCVESANAADDVVTILPGESHSMQVIYKIESDV